jgi:hypothetical protein
MFCMYVCVHICRLYWHFDRFTIQCCLHKYISAQNVSNFTTLERRHMYCFKTRGQICNLFAKGPRVDVKVKIFSDFFPIFGEKIGGFLKNQCYDPNFENYHFLYKHAIFSSKIFLREYFENRNVGPQIRLVRSNSLILKLTSSVEAKFCPFDHSNKLRRPKSTFRTNCFRTNCGVPDLAYAHY